MILLIDNYDSFTYNLYDYLLQMRTECRVYRNDEVSLTEIREMNPEGIVLSPGPKTPDKAGITPQIVRHLGTQTPILGICLGYQAIGKRAGAKLVKSDIPVHGKTSTIQLVEHPLFEGLPPRVEVMRYHSLQLGDLGQTALEVIAQTDQQEPMAIVHPHYPLYGFQFHPESILTEGGHQLLANWVHLLSSVSQPFKI